MSRVLSIQSTVVHGYVGNKAAMFPLQLHGLDVDPLNSVQLSNHTGYKYCTGQKFDGAQCREIMQGLKKNGLMKYQYVLSGYMGSLSFLEAVVEQIEELKRDNPDLFYGNLF